MQRRSWMYTKTHLCTHVKKAIWSFWYWHWNIPRWKFHTGVAFCKHHQVIRSRHVHGGMTMLDKPQVWINVFLSSTGRIPTTCAITTEAQRYHCKHNFTAASIILPPRDLFYHREIYFNAASFILLPRVLYHCREFCFTAASFVLLPRVLFYRREFYFHHRKFYFTAASFIFSAASFILFAPRFNMRIKLAAVK